MHEAPCSHLLGSCGEKKIRRDKPREMEKLWEKKRGGLQRDRKLHSEAGAEKNEKINHKFPQTKRKFNAKLFPQRGEIISLTGILL